MDWRPNRNDKIPLYRKIAKYIENGLSDRTFPPDKPSPSERTLAKRLEVNGRIASTLSII